MKKLKAKVLPKEMRLKRNFLKILGEYYRAGDHIIVKETHDPQCVATIEEIY